MYILYILAAMWAIGTFGAAYYVSDMVETFVGKIVYWFVTIPIWLVVGGFPVGVIIHESGPNEAVLKKADWECKASHQETTTTYIQSGTVLVPVTSTHLVCDVYGRK